MSKPHTIFVRPKAGLKITDPATKGFLPEEGRAVEPSIYWERRLNDGDVIAVSPTTVKPTVKPNKKDA